MDTAVEWILTDAVEALLRNAQELHRLGRVPEAVEAYKRVLALRADMAECWFNLGVLLRQQRQFVEALAAYQRALDCGIAGPEEVHLNRGVIYSDHLRQDAAAEQELQRALRLNPNYIPALLNLANLQEDLGHRSQARELYERILTVDPNCLEALARYANLQPAATVDNRLVSRLQAGLRTPASAAEHASILFALGRLLDGKQQYAAAFEAYTAANAYSRASAPPGTPAYDRKLHEELVDQLVRTYPVATESAAPMQGPTMPKRSATPLGLATPPGPPTPHGPAAPASSHGATIPQASATPRGPTTLKGPAMPPGPPTPKAPATARGPTTPRTQATPIGTATPRPIFICGLFRSGSTLAERLLAGHPQVVAGGELDILQRLAAAVPLARAAMPSASAPVPSAAATMPSASPAMLGYSASVPGGRATAWGASASVPGASVSVPGGPVAMPDTSAAAPLATTPVVEAALSPDLIASLANTYRDELRRLFPGAGYVTDKRPDNFLHIGLIKQLFPDSRIVHTTRDPLDNCLSIFFLHLDHSMGYALNLLDIGHYFRQYRRLMTHWRRCFGADLFDLDYDAFVRAPAREGARLFEFLGLDWDQRYLAVESRRDAVKTASVWQVREPIYTRSSGRAAHYAAQLQALRESIADLLPQ